MFNEWDVLSMLKQLCEIDEQDLESVRQICATSLKKVTSRLKDNIDSEDIRILSAATAIAFYNLCLKNADSVSSFQAGDIKIANSYSDRLKNAEKIKDDALSDIYPLFKDEEFFAGSVLI